MRDGLLLLVVVMFVAVQVTALSHELDHLLHRHDAPCGLHVVADHQVIVPAPATAPVVGLTQATGTVALLTGARLGLPSRSHGARAPPLLG